MINLLKKWFSALDHVFEVPAEDKAHVPPNIGTTPFTQDPHEKDNDFGYDTSSK